MSSCLGSSVQSLAYSYDQIGNPLSRSDANSSMSEAFTYDAVNRLTSATVILTPTPRAKAFSYDAIGNILSKSDVGNYGYAWPGSPLAVSKSTAPYAASSFFTHAATEDGLLRLPIGRSFKETL